LRFSQELPKPLTTMTADIRIIKHEAVPECGSFEVRFGDGRESRFFYWDNVPSRRLREDLLTRGQALAQAQALARVGARQRRLGATARIVEAA
jgi:hypothetical protein